MTLQDKNITELKKQFEPDSQHLEREQREQREQASCDAACVCSRCEILNGNCGNEVTTNVVKLQPTSLNIEIKTPYYESHTDFFKINDGKEMKPGLYFHEQFENGDAALIWISSPLSIKAITSSPSSDEFGRLLSFIDSNNKWHEWAMPMHMLKGDGEELRGELLNQGVIFNPKKRSHLIEFIMSERPERRITAASRIGWHGKSFVLPNQVIGVDEIVFQSEIAGCNDFSIAGSLEGWRQEIGRLCVGNIPLIVSVSTALAGPLLNLLNRQQGGALHWLGDSSVGKSTAIEVAATVWGSPEFIRSWSATANGLEGIAATRNDTCLILDEINEAAPSEIGKAVYMLGNGQGKQRAGRTGYARKIQRWRIMAISSGEQTLESLMREAGKQTNAGQIVRLLNIPISFEHGAFSNLHGFSDGATLADHLKASRLKNHGHVGPNFIQKLIEEKRDLISILNKITDKFKENISVNLEKRAAAIFALIGFTGELGIEYGLLPWESGSALNAAKVAFTRWQEFKGSGQTEDKRIQQGICDFINKHGDSRFSLLMNDANRSRESVQNRAGWYKDTDKGRIFMFTSSALIEAGKGYEKSRIVEMLVRKKWLMERDSDRFTKKTRTPLGSKGLYYIHIPYDGDMV